MVKTLDKLYKTDNKGAIRVWWVEIDGDKIRNVSGLLEGEKVASGWKLMKAKNFGKSNSTTPEQQAEVEAEALYEKQLGKGGYHRDINDASKKKYIEPMLAKTYDDMLPISFPVFSQAKLDGHRCIATKDGLTTRNGKRYVSVPHIEFALIKFFKEFPDAILDGELYNHELKDNFEEISSCVRKTKPTAEDIEQASKIEYHVYDLIDPSMTFSQRFDWLINNIGANYPKITIVDTYYVHTAEELDELYGKFTTHGYEGQMIRYNQPYEIGKRSKSLIKRKEFITEEFKLTDILEGEGNWAGYAKTVRYQLDEEREASAGIRGSQAFTKKLLEEREAYIGGEITLRYFQKTGDGIPRFPVVIEFFKDKRDI